MATADELRDLLGKHKTWTGVARATGWDRGECSRRGHALGVQRVGGCLSAERMDGLARLREMRVPHISEFASWPALEARRDEIAKRWKGAGKVLILNDLHIPYQRLDLVAQALEDHSDADLCVIAGDLLHAEALSTFAQFNPFPFEREWKLADQMVYEMQRVLPVVYLRANHERRLEKQVAKLPADTYAWVREHLPNLVQALMSALRERDKNARMEGIYDWFIRLGDAAICHADEYSSIPGRSVCNVKDYLRVNYPRIPWGSVWQAHTHHVAMLPYQETMCFETGCLCYDADYRRSGKLGPGKKERWQRAYGVLYLKGGKTDWDRSRFVWLE